MTDTVKTVRSGVSGTLLVVATDEDKGKYPCILPTGELKTLNQDQLNLDTECDMPIADPAISPAQRRTYESYQRSVERIDAVDKAEAALKAKLRQLLAAYRARGGESGRNPSIERRTRQDEVLVGVHALAQHLLDWAERCSGECRMDGKHLSESGGIGAVLRVRMSGFDKISYDVEYEIAGDTRYSAVCVFLERYVQCDGDVNLIFTKEHVGGDSSRAKLGLPVTHWNCRERQDT